MKRMEFICGLTGLGATAALKKFAFASGRDGWKLAFKSAGFDPEEDGSSYVVVTSDVHCPDAPFVDEQVAAWNSLDPKPAALISLGDMGQVCSYFGHRPDRTFLEEVAYPSLQQFKEKVVGAFRKDVPIKLAIGNHDTYAGEQGCELFCRCFPAVPLFESFEIGDVRFIKLNGGVDAVFDARQRTWFIEQVKTWPAEKTLVVLVHQPSIGMVAREYDVGICAKRALSERTGETWLWGGHEHRNEFRVFELPKTKLYVATHTRGRDGFWLYGIRNGRVSARLWWKSNAEPSGRMPFDGARSCGTIPVPYEEVERDVLWRTFVGEPEEIASRVSLAGSDNVHWIAYLEHIDYLVPIARVAPGATRMAVLGGFFGKRNERMAGEVYSFSADGVVWTEVRPVGDYGGTSVFDIPEGIRGLKNFRFRIDAFGMDCDDTLSGFALLR